MSEKTPEQKKAELEAKKKDIAEKKAAELAEKQAAADEKKAAALEAQAKKPKPLTLPVSRDSLSFVGAGLFIFEAGESLKDCKKPGAFKCINSKNFGIRKGDVVICKDGEVAEMIVVQ